MFSLRLPALRPVRHLVSLLALAQLAMAMPADAALPTYSLSVSSAANRSSPQALAGKTYAQPASIYVFATPTTSAKRVRFYLDDTTMSRTPRSIDSSAPFDFAGTASDGSAVALNLGTLSAASHTITAAVETTTNTTRVVSSSFTVTPAPDTTKPSSPVLSSSSGDQQITLNWSAATDNVGVTRYAIWMDNAYVTSLASTARSYSAGGLTNGVSHSFRVVAYDAASNYANSNTVTAAAVAPADTVKPSAPVLSATPGDQQVALSWTAATDNVGVIRYSVYQDDVYVTSLPDTARSYTASGLAAGASHSFRVTAYDLATNSADSNTVNAAALDVTKPSSAVLSATAGDKEIALAWTAATDDVGVSRYAIWMDNAYVTSLAETARSYTASGLTNGVSHIFRVVAYDAASNYANSNNVTAASKEPPDTTKPSAPVLSATPGDQQVALSWTAATDNVGVTRYAVYQDDVLVTSLADTARSYTVVGMTAADSHSFRVTAYDLATNSADSNTVSAAALDTTKPAAAVLSAAAGDGQVTLDWTAATDDVGVTRYDVYKDDALVTDLTASARSYTLTGLTNGVSHSFRVVAYDAAANSADSNTVSATAVAPADTTKPSAAVLSATPGDQRVTLDWTAATDNVGVTRYAVWMDNAWLTGLPATARTYAATGLAAGASHSFRVVAYDAADNYSNSNTVTAAATPPPPPGGGTPAPFPSRLRAVGRSIVDENGYALPLLRGFNVHVGPTFVWDQANFDMMKSVGATIDRAIIHWDSWEPTQGTISAAGLANLDKHVARAEAAGMYTLLELHLNVGRTPSWAQDVAGEVSQYTTYGQNITQTLAYRYGNPASPQYTKSVIGFGLNEPPVEDSTLRNGTGAIPWIEGKQRTMISWFRAAGYAPSWIGFVAYGYASATPIFNDATQNPNATDASPTAYDSVGGNVIIDLHDYMAYCTNTDPSCEGRQYNGMTYNTYQGGMLMRTGSLGSTAYTSSATRQSQHRAYLAPYKTFTTRAGIPLMIGEWGWSSQATGGGESAWAADKKAAWKDAGTAIQIDWNYDTSSSSTEWSARLGSVWRPSVTTLFAP
ncbi:MAG: hypothetical protein QOE31_1495 [Solirubrobacteraceae bacterium]|nr:hypothetical protein [Solirubrobacteraceae bacterium]